MVILPECIDDDLPLHGLDGVYDHCHCALIQGFKALQSAVACSGSYAFKHTLKAQAM